MRLINPATARKAATRLFADEGARTAEAWFKTARSGKNIGGSASSALAGGLSAARRHPYRTGGAMGAGAIMLGGHNAVSNSRSSGRRGGVSPRSSGGSTWA